MKIHPLWWMASKSSISMIASSLETGEAILLSNIYVHTDLVSGSSGPISLLPTA